MNATVTAKHKYYTSSLIGVFRPFANLSLPFRGLSPLQQKYTSISADVTRIPDLSWVLERLIKFLVYHQFLYNQPPFNTHLIYVMDINGCTGLTEISVPPNPPPFITMATVKQEKLGSSLQTEIALSVVAHWCMS